VFASHAQSTQLQTLTPRPVPLVLGVLKAQEAATLGNAPQIPIVKSPKRVELTFYALFKHAHQT
jgi:anti-sigma-K factor RskA